MPGLIPSRPQRRPCGTLWLAALLSAALALGVLLGHNWGTRLTTVAWVLLLTFLILLAYQMILHIRQDRHGDDAWVDLTQSVPSRIEVLESKRVFDQFFKIDSARLCFEKYDGTMSAPVTRLVFERGDAVAVLPYDAVRRELVLVQQLRYPAWTRNPADGWMWETIAGMQETGHSIEETARREAMEEAGYALGEISQVATIYTSPGGTSERLHILVAPVSYKSRTGAGGGLRDEAEDIRVCVFPLEQALAMLESGQIVNAITVVALQYVALHQEQLFDR